MEDFSWWVLAVVAAFVSGYVFNDFMELIFNSKGQTQQQFEDEQIKRLEASKKLREIEKDIVENGESISQ